MQVAWSPTLQRECQHEPDRCRVIAAQTSERTAVHLRAVAVHLDAEALDPLLHRLALRSELARYLGDVAFVLGEQRRELIATRELVGVQRGGWLWLEARG